ARRRRYSLPAEGRLPERRHEARAMRRAPQRDRAQANEARAGPRTAAWWSFPKIAGSFPPPTVLVDTDAAPGRLPIGYHVRPRAAVIMPRGCEPINLRPAAVLDRLSGSTPAVRLRPRARRRWAFLSDSRG